MRLGEIKNILERCLNENKQLFIDQEAIFGNQAYKIKNYGVLMDALVFLSGQKRGNADFGPIKSIIDEYDFAVATVQMPVQQFNQLNAYVSALNNKIPLYYSILETMVENQDEQMINIKIPEHKITSLKHLSEFNKRLEKILDMFAIDGQFDFVGVDKGSRRYALLATGVITYRVFIGSLNIAQEVFNTRQAYLESESTKIEYQAALSTMKKSSDYSDENLKTYIDEKLNLEITNRVEKILKEMKVKTAKGKPELQSQIIMATKELVKELGNGTEFHLSLNPPEYAEEIRGFLKIDYKKISAIIQAENAPKKLENKNKVKETETEQEIKSE